VQIFFWLVPHPEKSGSFRLAVLAVLAFSCSDSDGVGSLQRAKLS